MFSTFAYQLRLRSGSGPTTVNTIPCGSEVANPSNPPNVSTLLDLSHTTPPALTCSRSAFFVCGMSSLRFTYVPSARYAPPWSNRPLITVLLSNGNPHYRLKVPSIHPYLLRLVRNHRSVPLVLSWRAAIPPVPERSQHPSIDSHHVPIARDVRRECSRLRSAEHVHHRLTLQDAVS